MTRNMLVHPFLYAQSCRDARLLLKLSQQELADLAGISTSSVGRFERGEKVSDYAMRRLTEALEKEGAVFVRSAASRKAEGE